MFFNDVNEAPSDPIFGLTAAFNRDMRAEKVNLSVGVYRSSDLKTPILASVKEAEKLLVDEEQSKDYLPIDGYREYLEQAAVLVFGEAFWKSHFSQITVAQGVGGTGALRLGAEFLKEAVGGTVYVSDPTWPNHYGIFSKAGFKVDSYPYYNKESQRVDFDRFIDFLKGLSRRSIVILHACCHNPTGADLTAEQWQAVSQIFLESQLFPFFDFAYQGFGVGLEEDATAVRIFADAGHEMFVASSYSKNFALYSERVGALFGVMPSEKIARNVTSQIKTVIRRNYSNPPRHGAAVVARILKTPKLREEWELELTRMRERIVEMRTLFARALMVKNPRFHFLEDRHGLFSFCGLEKKQVEKIIKEYGIFMTSDGRINVAGLNWDNLDYVVNAIISSLNSL